MRQILHLLLSTLLVCSLFFPLSTKAATSDNDPTLVEDSPLNVELNDADNIITSTTDQGTIDWENTTAEVSKSNTIAQKFSDVDNSHWAKTEIYQMNELGIINGYPDGEFRASITINRGQAANMLTSALKLKQISYQPIFKDISKNSSFAVGALATYNAKIFTAKADGTFGAGDALTREEMASAIVNAFNLKDTGKAIKFNDWDKISPTYRESVKILAQHKLTYGDENGNFKPTSTVTRSTFSIFLYRSLLLAGNIKSKTYNVATATTSSNFKTSGKNVNFAKVTSETNPIYIRSTANISFVGSSSKTFGTAKDDVYNYTIGSKSVRYTLTVRTLKNGDQFVFSTINNTSSKKVEVDVFQTTNNVTNQRLIRFDRYKISKGSTSSSSYDLTSTPTGVLQLVGDNGHILDRMIGQAYRSRELSQSYKAGGQSFMRELYQEKENFSYVTLDSKFYAFYRLTSSGNDIVDSWYVNSEEKLFKTENSMNNWMQESATNYKKTNQWYTSQGPYNKMAITTEPMPKSNKGYGRNLLLVKEDRALELLQSKGDRYYETLVLNSFVNLEKFKGDDKYWYTEVTSTYLKSLYNITAPFVDSRFNEQIALFYYRAGEQLGIKNYKQPLKNYADLLVEQVNKGNVIRVNSNAYYIPDYYPVYQKVKTHTSMNHMLGGISILLHAYKEFGTKSYLNVARAEMNAISAQKSKWIRPNGDIFYKVSPTQSFVGTDYVHLTLEDLSYSYYLWQDIDSTYLPLLESMIKSKAGYLKNSKQGYTSTIKSNLETINMLKYLP